MTSTGICATVACDRNGLTAKGWCSMSGFCLTEGVRGALTIIPAEQVGGKWIAPALDNRTSVVCYSLDRAQLQRIIDRRGGAA